MLINYFPNMLMVGAAGAQQVYWLRSLKSSLADGFQELAAVMRADGIPVETVCMICESNSARRVVEPGLFVVVREQGDDFKPSCVEVIGDADRVTEFDGSVKAVHEYTEELLRTLPHSLLMLHGINTH